MPEFITSNLGKFWVILILVFALTGFFLLKNFSVKAQEQIKIIPDSYSGNWQNSEAALFQDLGAEATFEEFSEENSAYPLESLQLLLPEASTEEMPTSTDETATSTEESIITTATSTQEIATSSEETATTTDTTEEIITPLENGTSTATTTATKGSSFFVQLWSKIKNLFNFEVRAETTDCRHGSNRPCGSEIGECQIGVQICENGVWGECLGEVKPQPEICDQLDNDCDGQIDEGGVCQGKQGLVCQNGENRPCSTEVGACQIGVQICQNGIWGDCIGGIMPSQEICDEVDNDCDGEVDEDGVCGGIKLSGAEKVLILSGFGVSPPDNTEIKLAQLRLSLAGKGKEGDKLVIDYFHQNIWQNLAVFDLENEISNSLNQGYFLYGLPIFEEWEDLNNFRIRFTSVGEGQVFLDAVWLEVEHKEKDLSEEESGLELAEGYTLELISDKKDFELNEKPSFKFRYQKERGFFEEIGAEILSLFHDEYKDINIKAEVLGLNITPDVHYEGNGKISVDLADFEKPRQFRPGKYILKIEIENEGQIFIQNQEFIWGVLAINTNKSIYLPNETAYLQMAALKDDGHTICDANLELEIISPDRSRTSVKVERSGECGLDNVTNVPDYLAYYQVKGPGTYQMKLKNLDTGYEITDFFEVRESVPFEIERIGPTRIYPPAIYEMKIKIKANEDFIGQVKETIPETFAVESGNHTSFKIYVFKGIQELFWDVNWQKGNTYELYYQFDAPDISPYLYLLGPLQIESFQEIRQWQLASDATIDNEDWEAFSNGDTTLSGSFWSNIAGDDCDMQTDSGGTPSSNTGPSVDHTYGDSSHMYLYLETSSGWCMGNNLYAGLESDNIDADTYSIDIDFWWHMYGSTIGSLHLDVNDGSWHESVWSRSGQGTPTADAWYNQQVDLDAYTGTIQLRFRAISAGNYYGDLALDDIEIIGTLKNAMPNTPTLADTPAFPNKVTTTTQPVIGGFAAEDDEDEDVEFKLVIDDDYDLLSPALVKYSSDYPTDAGWEAAAFSSGATTTYTIQSGDALTANTTYWWAVVARDPLGSGNWSATSSLRSFTASTTDVAKWFQTTEEQFDNTGTLVGTQASTSDSVELSSGGNNVLSAIEKLTGTTEADDLTNVTVTTGTQLDKMFHFCSFEYDVADARHYYTFKGTELTSASNLAIHAGTSSGMDQLDYLCYVISFTSDSDIVVQRGSGPSDTSPEVFNLSPTLSALSRSFVIPHGERDPNDTTVGSEEGWEYQLVGTGTSGLSVVPGAANNSSGGNTIYFEVVDWGNDDITVQHINNNTLGSGETCDAVDITAVDQSKTWLIGTGMYVASGAAHAANNFASRVNFVDDDTIQMCKQASGVALEWSAQVIEDTNGNIWDVDTGLIQMSSSELSDTLTISSVDTDRTFAIGTQFNDISYTGSSNDTSTNNRDTVNATVNLTNSTTITATRGAHDSTYLLDIVVQAVEFLETTVSSGTITSPEIDFDWVLGRNRWGEVIWNTTEPSGTPANSDVKLYVMYTASNPCDTTITDAVLDGNESGFDVSFSPLNLNQTTALSTSTYNRICLKAKLILNDAVSSPTLNDWKITWEPVAGGNNPPETISCSIDSGAGTIALTAGSTKNVECAGTVQDLDGYDEITSVEGKLYRTSIGHASADDNNNHYTLTGDSQCIPSNGSDTTEDYTCTFSVYYYADGTDASSAYSSDTWTCRMMPSDAEGEGTAATDTIEMETLLALDVEEAEINYDTMNVGTDTGASNETANIINAGNVRIDVSFDGYGASDGDGKALDCASGSIGVSNEKYGSTDVTYSSLPYALSDSATERDWDILQRTNDSAQEQGTDKKYSYWGLAVPADCNCLGACSGHAVFTAVNDAGGD